MTVDATTTDEALSEQAAVIATRGVDMVRLIREVLWQRRELKRLEARTIELERITDKDPEWQDR